MQRCYIKTPLITITTLLASNIFLLQASASPSLSPPNYREFRLGIMQHDIKGSLKQRHEHGQNVIVEYIFDSQYEFLRGVPHIGVTINNRGYTSAIYTGLSWRVNLSPALFLDATFGAGLNNAERKKRKKRQAAGSNLLFRESLSLGAYIGNYTISIMIDHMSNARLTPPNPGITDFGVRIGYKF